MTREITVSLANQADLDEVELENMQELIDSLREELSPLDLLELERG